MPWASIIQDGKIIYKIPTNRQIVSTVVSWDTNDLSKWIRNADSQMKTLSEILSLCFKKALQWTVKGTVLLNMTLVVHVCLTHGDNTMATMINWRGCAWLPSEKKKTTGLEITNIWHHQECCGASQNVHWNYTELQPLCSYCWSLHPFYILFREHEQSTNTSKSIKYVPTYTY